MEISKTEILKISQNRHTMYITVQKKAFRISKEDRPDGYSVAIRRFANLKFASECVTELIKSDRDLQFERFNEAATPLSDSN